MIKIVRLLLFVLSLIGAISTDVLQHGESNHPRSPLRPKQFIAGELDQTWEDLVVSCPIIVDYLNLLMVFASNRNLALKPQAGYSIQYIENVKSLHATLAQVASAIKLISPDVNIGFARTHVNLHEIPEHLKAALFLVQTTPSDLQQQLLQYAVRNLQRAVNDGSAASRATVSPFVYVGQLLDEVVTVIGFTSSSQTSNLDEYYFLREVERYAGDVQKHWYRLVQLLVKFSDKVDLIRQSAHKDFVRVIEQAQLGTADRATQLRQLVPAAIAIDRHAYLCQTVAYAYTNVSKEYMLPRVAQSGSLLSLQSNATRLTGEHGVWQSLTMQSMQVSRLARVRQIDFVDRSADRQKEYQAFLTPARINVL